MPALLNYFIIFITYYIRVSFRGGGTPPRVAINHIHNSYMYLYFFLRMGGRGDMIAPRTLMQSSCMFMDY